MRCYEDAQAGVEKDAVAVCVACGMGLCLDHAVQEEVWKTRVILGRPAKKGMVVLCHHCAAAAASAAT